MIKEFILERKSWILLFILQQILILLISYLDPTIPFSSLLYIVFLSFIVFAIFLTVRYFKEIKFYKSLQDWDNSLDLASIDTANTPFTRLVVTHLTNQTEQLKETASQNQLALDQEKDELLSWIHEVKTPLTAMHLMIERLEPGTLKSQLLYEWLRIHLLLDQQLHQKRSAFIENDLYVEMVDLKQLVFKEIKALQSWCIQKGIGFDIKLEIKEVLSDGKWLAFIVRQLLTNAIKYSDSSDILIRSYSKNDRTILEIVDYGRGINQQDLPRIFDKGFTSTTNHLDHSSTGMGLYLTKKVAKPLLIDINVQSQLNKGTKVTLTFPKKNEFDNMMSM
ncbi:sensor histidine kinase [Metabacillus niabensis]|uniref:sensor histidine kinase n=1 Tax=Metabacillus TaxID=2675233 RepID=UPI000BA50F4A|nr:histidine kinase [Bacillus sp. 7586-K]